MTTSSDLPQEYLDKHGLGDEWEVRFTADELRAQEMANQYQEMGYEVELLPLAPGSDPPDLEELEEFGDGLSHQHNPLQYVQEDECGPCLDETFVVFTRGEQGAFDDTAVDDSLYD